MPPLRLGDPQGGGETLNLGWVPTILSLLICISFTIYAARYYLYALVTLLGGRPPERGGGDDYRGLVSIILPIYNEARVVDRLLRACTSIDYPEYEIIVVDDSTDPESLRRIKRWARHPRVRVIHRDRREGFKGGALNEGLRHLSPESRFVLFLDADFIPPPDILQRGLEHFEDDRVAAVQGYQDHVLNWDETPVTRVVRVSTISGYLVDFYARSLLDTLKQLTGGAMILRTEVIRRLGFSTNCLTEDWDLTLRLYLEGYEIVYDPRLRVLAECPSTLRDYIRQQMRWAEGHIRVARNYFKRVLTSPLMTLRQKMEFLLLSLFYLQSVLFLLGVGCTLIADPTPSGPLSTRLGLLLFLFDLLAPLSMGLTASWVAGGVRENLLGLVLFPLTFTATAPFLALASIRGLILEDGNLEEGWYRTEKTGHITVAPLVVRSLTSSNPLMVEGADLEDC
ncbi:glycosyltransferase family 2 protein [Candidatus Bathyarchaeota archaeon]|nr:MAG: glycosyltransferase family 2 protein [Candidatus Bathyarchaeota archaeon]